MAQMPVGVADPRLCQVAHAVVVCRKEGDDYVQVGAITNRAPRAQTVFRGELYAMLQLARYTSGTVDATLDCKGVLKRIRSVRLGKTHSDLWWALRPAGTHRLQMTWVPSHVTEQEFLQAVGPDHLCRKQVNERADELCGQLAASLVRAADKEILRLSDSNTKKAQEFLAGRAEKILAATGDNQHPVYKACLQRKHTVKVERHQRR